MNPVRAERIGIPIRVADFQDRPCKSKFFASRKRTARRRPIPYHGRSRTGRIGIFILARIAAIAALTLSGCWSLKKAHALNVMARRPDFKLCLLNNGIDPDQFAECYAQSADPETAKQCVSPDQLPIVKRCALESDVVIQQRTHRASCSAVRSTFLSTVNCTSN